MRRQELVKKLVELTPESVRLESPRDGWPAIFNIDGFKETHRVAIHAGLIGRSHRNRGDIERRFQNPGQGHPLSAPEGCHPLLIGIWLPEAGNERSQSILVGMEVTPARMEKLTRQSFFMPLGLIREAQMTGWATHTNAAREEIIAFRPELLPVYVEARRAGVTLSTRSLSSALEAIGLDEPEDVLTSEERTRRAANVLVRDARFSKAVIDAYDGLCAMCGLNFGLLEGAHILPITVPGSNDEIWNGLALCRNHHGAFDKHLIWVDPSSHQIALHPKILEKADLNSACRSFVNNTSNKLHKPASAGNAPRRKMLEQRYDHFTDAYEWSVSI